MTTQASISKALAVSLLLGLPLGTSADIIHLTDGQVQKGVVVRDQPGQPNVTIRTSQGELALPRTRIARIETEPRAIGLAHIGDQFLQAGNAEKAVENYKAAVEEDASAPGLAEKLQQAEAQLAVRAEQSRAADETQADTLIEETKSLIANKRFQEALETLRRAGELGGPARAERIQKATAEVYYQWGITRADHLDKAGSAEKLQLALRFDPTREDARAALIKSWEDDPTKLNEVVAYYKDSDKVEDRKRVADAYYKMRDYENALPIYLKLMSDPNFVDSLANERVTQMYDMLHRQYAQAGDYAKALEAYQAFMEYSPRADQVPLAKYEYMLRREQTDLGDTNARAQLAEFAEQKGLYETARSEYSNILAMAPDNAIAKSGLMRFAESDLQDARDFYGEGQYLLAYQKADLTARDYGQFPQIVTEARDIMAKSEVEREKAERNKAQQAVALALRGDDYYNRALSYISAYTSTNVREGVRVFSPKNEAVKNLNRALSAWRTALQLDPSLGAPTSYDLHQKISDAYAQYVVLANPLPPRLPARDLDRVSRGQTSSGSR